jgi:UDP-N-acetylmuramoylalanine--D-glutamate ligase
VAAGITNIKPDHLDRYPSFEQYRQIKHRVFRNMGPHDFAVVRANDPDVAPPGGQPIGYVPRGRRRTPSDTPASGEKGPQILTFGATGLQARVDEGELELLERRVPIESLPFREPHNLQNACLASLLAYAGLRATGRAREEAMPECVIRGLGQFRGLAHRMEALGEKGGVRVINNSMCTNPDAVIKSVQAVKDPTHIVMGGVNKNVEFAPLRNYLASYRHHVYLYGADSKALNQMLGGNHPEYSGLREAFEAAAASAVKGEVIMLAPGCASTDSFRDFRERGDVFKSIAKEWLSK